MSFKKIIKLENQGFCFGVKRAIKIAVDSVNDPSIKKPIYMLGNIVHNKNIDEMLSKKGIITINGTNRLEMIEQVPDNATLIFSAHGVSDKVRIRAIQKNLTIIDATCPYVESTFKQVESECLDNDIIFIGKLNHPETEAALELSDKVHLYNKDTLSSLNLGSNIKIAHQTTMSKYDINQTLTSILKIYPHAKLLDMICKVTENRQTELANVENLQLEGKTLVIIIGDKNSNNSTKLYELSTRIPSVDSVFIETIEDLDLFTTKSYTNIVIGSGTSTPEVIINEIYDVLLNIDNYNTQFIKSKNKDMA